MFVKLLSEMYLWTRKKCFSFGIYPPLDPDPGIFWRRILNSTLRDVECFNNLAHLSRKIDRIFAKILSPICYLWTRKSPYRVCLSGELRCPSALAIK